MEKGTACGENDVLRVHMVFDCAEEGQCFFIIISPDITSIDKACNDLFPFRIGQCIKVLPAMDKIETHAINGYAF